MSVVVVVVVVAFKCLCFFLTASFDLSLIPLCLFPLHTHRPLSKQTEPKAKTEALHLYSLYFLTLAFRMFFGLINALAGTFRCRRFSSDASPDLAANELRWGQSKRFYAAVASKVKLFFFLFVFVSTISQSSVSHRGGFSEHDIHN